MGNLFFTSDLHLSHKNLVFKYEKDNRRFRTLEDHDNFLINEWNKKINPEDTVFFLGDFSLKGKDKCSWYKKTLDTLNGTKILILGNHDKLNPFTYIKLGFHSVHTHYILNNICMVHDPIDIKRLEKTNSDITTFLCGHVHSLFKVLETSEKKRVINVGVDVWNLSPVSYSQIQEEIWLPENKKNLFEVLKKRNTERKN